ncbi:outer membrane protein assembly factor BamC [Microbulbifer sp. TYP-18]|uniref:outer membrane protein assembly factor BamC n=1 Tax=Microbulbifer sp. TYP-18 TaxID=3230024 RepID=UPI0034C61694
MTKLTTGVALLGASIALSGCGIFGGEDGYFRDRSDDYQLADSLPPLRMPEGVKAPLQEELYEVPQTGTADLERGKFEVPRPQALAANVGLDRVKIQKLGNRRWVLVSQPPEEVWPQLHYFLRQSGLQLASSDVNAGRMETAWLTFKQTPETKDKFFLQVESGVQPDTTEVHVRHFSAPVSLPASVQVEWPAQSTDPEREGWMIDEMSSALAADSSGAAASLVAQAIGGGAVKVGLQEPAGREPYLFMGLERERAVATLVHALNSGAFRLHQEDTATGIFYVTFDKSRELSEEEKDGGWFSWGSDDEDTLAEEAEGVTLPQLMANIDTSTTAEPALFDGISGVGGAEATEIPGYLVVLRSANGLIEVRIRDTRGQPLSRGKTSELLMAIRQNLI